VADVWERLRREERRAEQLRQRVRRLRAQISILSEEARSPMQRTVGGAPAEESFAGVPSYSLAARLHRRANRTGVLRREGIREPILQLSAKLPARRFAAVHGLRVARILGRWKDPEAIDWDRLPERFVIKSNVGGGAVNVFPLARGQGVDEYVDLLTGQTTSQEAVTAGLRARHKKHSIYFAEEFLVGIDTNATDVTVPTDIKVFCFYGEPAYLEVRRGDQSRARDVTSRARAFAPDGTELTDVRALIDSGEGDLDPPADLTAVLEAAARLSAAIRRPLERLDFFETDDGLVFGEVTQNPGHLPALVPEWDRHLGEVYERAYARLLHDLATEGALHVDPCPNSPEGPPGTVPAAARVGAEARPATESGPGVPR
jgi:hypothetical protein